ncbi:MAG: SIS domain-containing protein [Clostridia bacterium]|nr:SIS domain-containing protein [Clostridia bacterium]
MESLNSLIDRYPALSDCGNDVTDAVSVLEKIFENGGKLFVCGNGGSAADADHIVGELAKGFMKKRPVSDDLRRKLEESYGNGARMADGLQEGLPVISLHSQSSLLTAIANDTDSSLIFAQTLFALSCGKDALLALSTSGNSENVVNAARLAKILGLKIIALTGKNESDLSEIADVTVRVGETETYRVQELHLPVYHWICAKLEEDLFKE